MNMTDERERNVVVTARGLQALVRSPLSKVEGIVLWHLVESLPVTGNVISKVKLASDVAITAVHTTRGMKRLCELGFLIRGPKVGVSYHYKLNPAFFRILS